MITFHVERLLIAINNRSNPRLQIKPTITSPRCMSHLLFFCMVMITDDARINSKEISTYRPIENAPRITSGINAPTMNQFAYNQAAP